MDISPTIQHPHGRMLTIAITDPAANTNWSHTVPSRRRWKIHALRFTFTTDDNAADRFVRINITDGTNIFHTIYPPAAQPASLAHSYQYAIHGQQQGLIALAYSIPFPDIMLMANHIIASSTADLQAGDDFSGLFMLIEEWIDP